MDSLLLEYFLRVAELGSINKAAADLNLSQPSLSRHVAALERDMGSQLFHRRQNGVHLTESGKLLSDRARPLLRQFAILRQQVAESAAGQLSIGIPPSWQQVFTSTFVGSMVGRHPDIKLRVHEGVSNVLRDHLFAGVLDLCILPFDGANAVGYEQTPLVREPLVLVASSDARLTANHPVPISVLDDVRLVLPGRPNALRAIVERALTRKRLRFRLAVETDTLTLCLQLASQGLGHTVVPACAVVAHSLGAAISWAPIRGLTMTWALGENGARMHSAAVREGKRVVEQAVRGALSRHGWPGAHGLLVRA